MLKRNSAHPKNAEPRWPVLVALLAVGGIYMALPEKLIIGPRWLLLGIVSVLSVPALISYHNGKVQLNRVLGYVISSVITLALLISLFFLIIALPQHEESAPALLQSAAILWLTNIVVFGLWYWRLDAGGPHLRGLREGHTEGSFLFPQMTQYIGNDCKPGKWAPDFIDYLFIAFNTATAFSPTDTPVLSKWAKMLSMLEAIISLTIVAVLVSRGIGLL
jgi:hypothetical protein